MRCLVLKERKVIQIFFEISKGSLSCSLGVLSFSTSRQEVGLSVEFELLSTGVEAFVSLTNNAIVFGLSVVHYVEVVNGKRMYFGCKFRVIL